MPGGPFGDGAEPYVLVTGYRQALASALSRMGIAYSVWSEKPLRSVPPGIDRLIVDKYPSPAAVKNGLPRDPGLTQQPTHVIAGTEAAVFPAAVLRRIFGARRSPDTLLIRCTDKAAMKNYLRRFDVPMTRYRAHSANSRASGLIDELGLPVVIKSKRGSGGRNIVIARSIEAVAQGMHRNCLYEAYIDAPEGSIETFIDNGRIVFSSITNYLEKKFANIVPASFAPEETDEIESLNRRVIRALKIRWGLTHLEYYRTPNGILFGEIALRPPGGYIMRLIEEAHGFNPWELLVQVELGVTPHLSAATSARFAGCLIFHPGEGTVSSINKPAKDDYPTIVRCSVKAEIGDIVNPRIGVGEDVGYCIFSSPRHDDVIRDIRGLQAAPPIRTQS